MVKIDEPGLSIMNTFDRAGRCILNDVRSEEVDDQGRPAIERTVFTFAYTLNAEGRIIATEIDTPSRRRKVEAVLDPDSPMRDVRERLQETCQSVAQKH